MKVWTRYFVAGVILLLISTLFGPQGISDFAGAAATNETVPAGAAANVAIGAVLVLCAAGLLARGYFVRSRYRAPDGR